jgi:hypothetical protein
MKWAPDEKERFERGVKEHGRNYIKVAVVVGTRTLTQVRDYAKDSARRARKTKDRKDLLVNEKGAPAKQKGAPITSTNPSQWDDDLGIEGILPLLTEEEYDADDINFAAMNLLGNAFAEHVSQSPIVYAANKFSSGFTSHIYSYRIRIHMISQVDTLLFIDRRNSIHGNAIQRSG